MSSISNWSVTAANNNSAAPDGFPEAMAPSAVNNASREVMAAVRTFYNSIEWRDWGHTITYASATSFTTAAGDGDTTAVYHAGRRIHANGTTTGDIYGTISSSSHSGSTTVNITWDSGSLQNEALTIEVGFAVDQLSIGEDASYAVIPAGAKMLFYAAAAPTGWTIDTTVDDKFVIVDDENGGSTGGTDAPASTYTPAGSADSHILTIAEMPAHTHPEYAAPDTSAAQNLPEYVNTAGSCTVTACNTGSTGGGGGHTHTWTASNNYAPAWMAFILCTKD